MSNGLASTTTNAENLQIGAGEFFFQRELSDAEKAAGQRSQMVSLGEVSSANFTQNATTVEKNSSLRAPRETIAEAVTSKSMVATLSLDEFDPLNVSYALYGEAGVKTIAERKVVELRQISPGEVLHIEDALNFSDLELALLIPEQAEIKAPVLSTQAGPAASTVQVRSSGSYTGAVSADYYVKIVQAPVKAGISQPALVVASGLTTGQVTASGSYTGSQSEDFYLTISVSSKDMEIGSLEQVTTLGSTGDILVSGTYTGQDDEDYYLKITTPNSNSGDIAGTEFAWKKGLAGTYSAPLAADGSMQALAEGLEVLLDLAAGEDFVEDEEYKFFVQAKVEPKFVYQRGLDNPLSANMALGNDISLVDGLRVSFTAGHYQKGDQWKISANIEEKGKFIWRENLSGSYSTQPVEITGTAQTVAKGVNVTFDLSNPNATIELGDEWKISALAQRTALTPEVDFKCDETDARGGFIHILPEAGIENNTSVLVRCSVPEKKYPIVHGGLNNGITGRLIFNGDPTHGKPQKYDFHKVVLTPSGDIPLISTDFSSFSIDCKVLSDRVNHPDSPFYTVIYTGPANNLQDSINQRP